MSDNNGFVKWYNKERGFGIIVDNKTNVEYFVHYTEIEGNQKDKFVSLQENEHVKYNIKEKNNKKCAINIRPEAERFQNVQVKQFKKNHVRNTTEFTPSHDNPDMRIMVGDSFESYNYPVTSRDIIIVKNLFDKTEDIYNKLKTEIHNSGLKQDNLWKSWHGDTHFIADDHQNWKDSCPTFQNILTKISEYFNMDIKATRLNHYNNSREWKPFHHDAAAVKKDKAKTQNFTVAVSFGLEREVAFQHAKNGTIISVPAENGSVYVFSKDVNIIWKHGIRQMKEEDFIDQGRFSVIAWGWREMIDL